MQLKYLSLTRGPSTNILLVNLCHPQLLQLRHMHLIQPHQILQNGVTS
jgi:hypothetical protein